MDVQKIAGHLADIILCADDILEMLRDSTPPAPLREVEPFVRDVYCNVNALMKSICH